MHLSPLRAARAALAVVFLTAATAATAGPAAAHPVSHPGPPRVRNLRPAFGEVVTTGSTILAAQVVSDVAITGHTFKLDGVPVNARREGSDPSHPTIAADVTLTAGEHIAELDVTGSDGRTGGRAWRFSASDFAVRRIAGPDRIATAVAVSRDLYAAPATARAAVLARSDDFADALAGAALAQQVDGPVLLTTKSSLSPATSDELSRVLLPGSTVYLLGGTGALADQVAAEVQAAGFTPKRLAGDNRFATATAIAAELTAASEVFVVNGGSFPDALGASSPSAAKRFPVLLTAKDAVPAETSAWLRAHPVDRIHVVGGTSAIASATYDALAALARSGADRTAGSDRYDTALAVARAFFTTGAPVVVASGRTFPDALAGGRRAASLNAPLLLAPGASLADEAGTGELRPSQAVLLGGTSALGDGVAAALRRAANDAGAPRAQGFDPFPGAQIATFNPLSITFDRAVDAAQSNVYASINGEEVPGTIAAGDFADTLVFTPAEIPVKPALGSPVDIRVVVAGFDGTSWRHVDYHLTYVKLDMARGDSGPAVMALQQQLSGLGYWLGTADGSYGLLTAQAVMAFQKVHGLRRTGAVDEATRRALRDPARPAAREGGDHVELDKARQVIFVVRGGQVVNVLNTSTGTEQPYTFEGQTYIAHTPTGRFTISREVDGVRESRLGTLYRPKYWTSDGVAFHGSASIPGYPASHGCARLTNAAMDWIWASNIMAIGTRVVSY